MIHTESAKYVISFSRSYKAFSACWLGPSMHAFPVNERRSKAMMNMRLCECIRSIT